MNSIVSALPNEPALVSRAAGEPAAFATIYDHYFPRIYNYVRYRVSDAQTADDITAEVFERLLRKIDDYQPDRAPFGAWIFAIARHAVADYLRGQRRRRWLSLEALRGRAIDKPQPEELVMTHDRHRQLLDAVQSLSEREQDIIALKFTSGLTNRRIAEIMDLRESNVGVILYRAIRKLRAMLEVIRDE